MRYALTVFIMFLVSANAFGDEEFRFKLNFSNPYKLLDPANRIQINKTQLEPKLSDYPRLNLGYDGPVFREPKYNLIREIRDNAERIISTVFLARFFLLAIKRYQEESPIQFNRYENGVRAKLKWKPGEN